MINRTAAAVTSTYIPLEHTLTRKRPHLSLMNVNFYVRFRFVPSLSTRCAAVCSLTPALTTAGGGGIGGGWYRASHKVSKAQVALLH